MAEPGYSATERVTAADLDLDQMSLDQLRAELERIDTEMAIPPVAGTAMATVWRNLYDLALRGCRIQVEITRRYAAQAAEVFSMRAVPTGSDVYDGKRWRPGYVMVREADHG